MQLCSPPFTSSPKSSYNRYYGNSVLTFKNGCYCIFKNIYFLLEKKMRNSISVFVLFFLMAYSILSNITNLGFHLLLIQIFSQTRLHGAYNKDTKKPVLNLMQFQLRDTSILWTPSALIQLKTESIGRPSNFWYDPNSSQKHFSSFCVALQPLYSSHTLHHIGAYRSAPCWYNAGMQ